MAEVRVSESRPQTSVPYLHDMPKMKVTTKQEATRRQRMNQLHVSAVSYQNKEKFPNTADEPTTRITATITTEFHNVQATIKTCAETMRAISKHGRYEDVDLVIYRTGDKRLPTAKNLLSRIQNYSNPRHSMYIAKFDIMFAKRFNLVLKIKLQLQ